MVFVLKVKLSRECKIHLFRYLDDAEKEKAFLNRRGIDLRENIKLFLSVNSFCSTWTE